MNSGFDMVERLGALRVEAVIGFVGRVLGGVQLWATQHLSSTSFHVFAC